jgi:transposase
MYYALRDFQADYPDDAACLDQLMHEQHDGAAVICPSCGVAAKFHRISRRRAYACQRCGHHIYPCAGTLFEKSRTSLTTWLYAIYLFTATDGPIAVKHMQRQLGVTYKCAWRMMDELRKLSQREDAPAPRPRSSGAGEVRKRDAAARR